VLLLPSTLIHGASEKGNENKALPYTVRSLLLYCTYAHGDPVKHGRLRNIDIWLNVVWERDTI